MQEEEEDFLPIAAILDA